MQDLNAWVQAQLKRGYSKEQIKQYLAKKGYGQAAAAQVDKAIAPGARAVPKRPAQPSPPKFNARTGYKAVALIAIVVLGLGLLWLADALSKEKSTPNVVSESQAAQQQPEAAAQTPEPVKALLSAEYQKLCDEFNTTYKIGCGQAVGYALADTPGNIESVSIGTREVPRGIKGAKGRLVISDDRFWLFDIKLDKPYTDKNLNQKVNMLRVRVSTDLPLLIYREAIN